jgi:tripartite ATP-independent transporter DctP family solute receptor
MLRGKGRRTLAGVTALACVALAAGVTKVDAQGADKLEIKLGHVATPDNPYHLGAQRFAQLVSERTNGQVTVKIFPNAQLGNERDLIEGLQLGTIQMTIAANAPLSRYTTKVLLFDLPFLFRDDAHWDKVVDGAIGRQIADDFAQYGFRALGYFDGGWRSPYNSKKPITSIDDIKGMKFRTMESPMHISIYQAMGARGVPMASSEQYSALEQGVVDGSDAPISFYSQLRHHEIAKHLSSLPLFKLTVHLLIGEKTFQSLSPATREVLVKAGREAAAFERSKAREIDAKLLKDLQAKGVKISPLAPADRDKFIDAMRNTVWVEYGEKVGKDRIQGIIDTR